jgi:hypothetical protein
MQENIRNLKEVHKEFGDTFQEGWEWPRTLNCHPSTYRYVQTKSKKQMLQVMNKLSFMRKIKISNLGVQSHVMRKVKFSN